MCPIATPDTQGLRGIFFSAVQTADETEQSIAHLLSRTPATVIVIPDGTDAMSGAMTVTEGTHTSTYVKVTVVASGRKYRVIAF